MVGYLPGLLFSKTGIFILLFNITEALENWIKGIIIGQVTKNLESFGSQVNEAVKHIGTNLQSPGQWQGGAVLDFVKQINTSVIIPLAGVVITAVFCVELIDIVVQKNNMNGVETFDVFKFLFKMVLAVYIASHAFEFTVTIFNIGQHLVKGALGVVGKTATIDSSYINSLTDALQQKNIGELFTLAIFTEVAKYILIAMGLVVHVVILGRMLEIYLYTSVASLPFSTLGNKEWGGIGTNYIRALFALAVQGLLIVIVVGIYSVLVRSINHNIVSSQGNILNACIEIIGCSIMLCFMLFKTQSISKSIFNAH